MPSYNNSTDGQRIPSNIVCLTVKKLAALYSRFYVPSPLSHVTSPAHVSLVTFYNVFGLYMFAENKLMMMMMIVFS